MAREKICGIYLIKNLVNGKVYVGSSTNIKKRWNTHIRNLKNNKHHNIHMQRSWNKYGETNFQFVLLEKIEIDYNNRKKDYLNDVNKKLDIIESQYIFKYSSLDIEKGYNIREAGNRGSHSQETIEKLKKIKKGTQKGELNNMYGKKHSEESKKKMSDAQKGKYISDETKLLWSEQRKGKGNGMYGKKHSEESKKKMSKYAKKTRKKYRIISPNGEIYIIDGFIKEFCEDHNIKSFTGMYSVLKGLKSNHKGWFIEYI